MKGRKDVSLSQLRDALYYLSPESGVSVEHASGCLVGVVAGIMSQGKDYAFAISLVRNNLPVDAREECFPSSWRSDLRRNS